MYSAIRPGHTRAVKGFAGEKLALRFFASAGIKARRAYKRKFGDLILGTGVKIEVKTATLNKENRYAATLYKKREGKIEQNYKHADIVLMICVDNTGKAVLYLIPVSELGERSTLKIPRSHNTKFRPYRIGA